MHALRSWSRSRCTLWAALYAVAVIYSSTVVGPNGLNFVEMNAGLAWEKFLTTPYLTHGSDQRADWMANLLMLLPLGVLATAAIQPRNRRSILYAVPAITLCLLFVLAVKYLQLFFPGRTVSINYIVAQSLGVLLGTTVYLLFRERIRLVWAATDARELIIACLFGYAALYCLFLLIPLDFTLSADDLHKRLDQLRPLLFSLPGNDRSAQIEAMLMGASAIASVPLGILLAAKAPKRSTVWYLLFSLAAVSLSIFVKCLVMSATPHLAALAYDTFGMLLGVYLANRMRAKQVTVIRKALLRALPLLIPLYVLALLEANGLLASQWRSFSEAMQSLDHRGLIPFWHWYIVSKAQAAQSQAVHIIMFAPIGVMFSLSAPERGRGAWAAAVVACLFALLIECGRWFRPGLAPDFYEAVTAAIAAGLAVPLMQFIWRSLESERPQGTKLSGNGAAVTHRLKLEKS